MIYSLKKVKKITFQVHFQVRAPVRVSVCSCVCVSVCLCVCVCAPHCTLFIIPHNPSQSLNCHPSPSLTIPHPSVFCFLGFKLDFLPYYQPPGDNLGHAELADEGAEQEAGERGDDRDWTE